MGTRNPEFSFCMAVFTKLWLSLCRTDHLYLLNFFHWHTKKRWAVFAGQLWQLSVTILFFIYVHKLCNGAAFCAYVLIIAITKWSERNT